jgi:hypothetical protein
MTERQAAGFSFGQGDIWSALTCQRFGRLRPVAAVRVKSA